VFSAFLIASVVLAVTPGPGVLYIVTRSLTQGRRFGLASVAGVALGNLGNAAGASIGLAAVFAVSALAFTVHRPEPDARLGLRGDRRRHRHGVRDGRGGAGARPDPGPWRPGVRALSDRRLFHRARGLHGGP